MYVLMICAQHVQAPVQDSHCHAACRLLLKVALKACSVEWVPLLLQSHSTMPFCLLQEARWKACWLMQMVTALLLALS